MVAMQMLGYFVEEAAFVLAIFCITNLMLLKFTGNVSLVGFVIAIGGTAITIYNIAGTGQIYSYNHKWFLILMLFIYFSSNRFTFSYLIFALAFQFYSYYSTTEAFNMLGTKEEYFYDNLAYLILSYIFLLVFIRLHNIQNSKIDNQNIRLLGQKQALVKGNKLLKHRSEQLLESNQELERFVYIASHDLKSPLHNIIGFSHLLEKELLNFNSEKAHKYFKFIKKASNKMNNIIVDVLEYTKLSSNKVRNEDIDVNKLIESIKDSISEFIKEKNGSVVIINKLPSINAERVKMYLLFKNLIENGIKYNESQNPLVEIGLEEYDKNFNFLITDNGIGIDTKFHESIFKMFSRLHNDSEYEGTGLGLALCKKIVKSLNGEIDLISKKSKGTTFIVKIPKNKLSNYKMIKNGNDKKITNKTNPFVSFLF